MPAAGLAFDRADVDLGRTRIVRSQQAEAGFERFVGVGVGNDAILQQAGRHFVDDDLQRIETRMGELAARNIGFVQEVVPKVPAILVQRVIGALVTNYKKNRIADIDGEPEPFRDFVARSDIEQLRKWAVISDWTPPPPKKKAVEAGEAN